jgi:hypothetical protein
VLVTIAGQQGERAALLTGLALALAGIPLAVRAS